MDNYSGGQADGRFSSSSLAGPNAGGLLSPARTTHAADNAQPILHGNPYGPAAREGQPNCQAGQTGYALGEALIPGQRNDNPTFGVPNISKALGIPPLGKTDLFLTRTEQDRSRGRLSAPNTKKRSPTWRSA